MDMNGIEFAACVTILLVCIFMFDSIITTLEHIFRRFRKPKRKQHCFVYCPRCTHDLISSNSFVEDKDGIAKYKCKLCGNISFWDFASYPIPYLITCAGDCEYFYIDKFGLAGCDQECFCDPDTMTLFRKRTKESVYE